MGYFTILAAIPGFFLSSLILMLLWLLLVEEQKNSRIFGVKSDSYLRRREN